MEYTPIADMIPVEHPAADRASAYGLEKIIVDGNDADAGLPGRANGDGQGARRRGAVADRGRRPIATPGTPAPTPAKYRPPGELEEWMKRDPIKVYQQRLAEFGVPQADIDAIEQASKQKVEAATEACKVAPVPPESIITTDVYADGGWAWRN